MNHEIIFKGFCPSKEGGQIITLNGKDIRGDWKEGYHWSNELGNHFIKVVRDSEGNFINPEEYEVEEATVCQYTGLKGKDDRRIWEGDIVASYGKVFKTGVKWNETQAGYAPFCSERTSFFADECSIIGDKFNTRSNANDIQRELLSFTCRNN